MNVLSWFSNKQSKIEQEKKELKVELTQAIMRFERRRGEVDKVASEVMALMHRRRADDEKT